MFLKPLFKQEISLVFNILPNDLFHCVSKKIPRDKKALKLDFFHYSHSESNKHHYNKAQLSKFLYLLKAFLCFYTQLTDPLCNFSFNFFV